MSNSIIIVAWPLNGPRVEQPPSISNILQGDSSCLPPSPYYPPLAVASPSLLCSTGRQLFPEFIHASWWRGPHYPRWMDSSSIPRLRSALPPSLAPSPPSSAPFFSFSPSFLFLFFSFFKTCRLTEARRSFIRFSGPVFSARITKRFLGPSGRIVIQRGEGKMLTGCATLSWLE